MRNGARLALATAGLFLVSSAPALAQDSPAVENLKKKYAKKSDKAFIKKVAWEQDYAKARKSAADSGKLIFAYFTRSHQP